MNGFIGLDCPTFDPDFVSFTSSFDHHIILFQADNNPDNPTDRRDLIADLNAASHLLCFFVFFLLGTDQNKIENHQN